MLEEEPLRFLLASVSPGLVAAEEVAKRPTLWEVRRFEDPLRPWNFLLRPENKLSMLPTCRSSTRTVGVECGAWRLRTDGGANKN